MNFRKKHKNTHRDGENMTEEDTRSTVRVN